MSYSPFLQPLLEPCHLPSQIIPSIPDLQEDVDPKFVRAGKRSRLPEMRQVE